MRQYRVQFSLTERERALVEEAAGRPGLALGAYAAQVVLAAAGAIPGGRFRRSGRRCGS